MTRVHAPSRLHFGLLHVGHRPGASRFGGCGLMVERPGVVVAAEPADHWSAEGPNAERALAFARMVTSECHRVVVGRCPPEHVGLGVGTALGLAVAKAIRPDQPTEDLARLVGRGARSGVGLHGFDRGGFVIDGGKGDAGALPRLVSRHAVPPDWRVVLVVPDRPGAWHGCAEQAAFDRLNESPPNDRTTSRMEALLFGELGPALDANEFDRFALALGEYNRLAGEPFAKVQGGPYAANIVAEITAAAVHLGFPGAGQSSWGPTVFAFTPDTERAEYLRGALTRGFDCLGTVEVVRPADTGASVELTGQC